MMQWMKFMKFVQCIWSKTNHFTHNFGTNMTKHVSKKELYIILSTLEKNLRWNRTVLMTKSQAVKNGRLTCNNFNRGDVFNGKSYFVNLFGNKVNSNTHRYRHILYKMYLECQYQSLCSGWERINKLLYQIDDMV